MLLGIRAHRRSELNNHEAPSFGTDVPEKLMGFMRGECTPEERIEVCELLRDEPAWLRWLANTVKLTRSEEVPRRGAEQ